MMRMGLAAVLVLGAISPGCKAGFQGQATAKVDVSADINLPLAQMPAKYASWVVEAEGYLFAVNEAFTRHGQAIIELSAALGVEASADAIARFIRDSIKVETELLCTPPSFSAGLVAECTAQAGARASGSAGGGSASGEAAAGIEANCQARASLSLSPGSCTMKTTVTQHPILSDAARWAKVEANMKIILQLSVANSYLNGRGSGLNGRGLKLHVEAVTDLASDPTLVLQLNNIQAELQKGSNAVGAANDKQFTMNGELDVMAGAIDGQFPSLRASVKAGP